MADRDEQTGDGTDGRERSMGEEFVQLFTIHQRRLYLYILSQVGNAVDAEEVLQETNVVIWNKFHTFRTGTNFYAWACRIAGYEVLKQRDRHRRDRLYFSEEFIERVAEEAQADTETAESRREALTACLGKLSPRDRELIRKRYEPGGSGKRVAEMLGRPANSVYQSLSRIRRALFECINRRLAAEAGR